MLKFKDYVQGIFKMNRRQKLCWLVSRVSITLWIVFIAACGQEWLRGRPGGSAARVEQRSPGTPLMSSSAAPQHHIQTEQSRGQHAKTSPAKQLGKY